MLLFTPRNFYLESIDSYMMLRQIGMEYYNCNRDNWVQEMAKSYLVQRRKENKNYYKNLRKECAHIMNSYGQSLKSPVNRKCAKSVSISYTAVLNSSKNMESRHSSLLSNVCEANEKLFPENCGCDGLKTDRLDNYCVVPPTIKNRENFLDEVELDYKTSMLTSELDHRSAESLKRIHLKRKCELLYLSDNNYKPVNFDSAEPEVSFTKSFSRWISLKFIFIFRTWTLFQDSHANTTNLYRLLLSTVYFITRMLNEWASIFYHSKIKRQL